MAVGATFLSTLAMGLFLLVILVTLSLAGQRRSFSRPRLESASPLSVLAGPVGWVLGFMLAALVVGYGAVVAISDGAFVPGLGGEFQPVVLAALSALLGLYVLFGSYYAARSRGAPSSLAAAASIGLVALAFVAVVTLQLVGVI